MKETIIAILLFSIIACENKTDEFIAEDDYSVNLLRERAEKDINLKNDPHSPFNRDPEAVFSNLKYFNPDTNYIFNSKLYKFETVDTITIMGTRGEQRKAVKEGYLILNFEDVDHKLNVYKSFGPQGEPYYSMWFTDLTSGNETYKIGRYLDFTFSEEPDFFYTIDFNRAYNPYCAYSELFTCPIPTKEDHLNFAIKAGEKNFNQGSGE
jgi:uncharacterized protein